MFGSKEDKSKYVQMLINIRFPLQYVSIIYVNFEVTYH